MRAGFTFVALIGLVSALPLASEDSAKLEQIKESLLTTAVGERVGAIESVILELLEQLREMLVTGTDTIPPLDPVTVERIHLDDQTLPVPGAFLKINNLTVRGISTFQVDDIKLTMVSLLPQRQRLDFDIAIPVVNADTDSYDLSIMVFGGEIYGSGNMRLRIVNPRIKGNIVVGVRISLNGIFLNIVSCRVSVGLDSFEPVITGMFDDEASSEFVSRFLRNLIPELLDFFEEDITNFLSSAVMDIGNEILADLDIGSLLPLSPATQ